MILANLREKFSLLFFTFLVGVFLLFDFSNVFAFSVSPLKQTMIVAPGSEVEFSIEIINDSPEVKSFLQEVDGFEINSETGIANFGNFSDAQNWTKVGSSKLTLQPNEKGEFKFLFDVPESAQPGAYYLGLFAKEVNAGGQVSLSSRVGSLLFLYVEGEVREDLVRTNFSASKKVFFSQEFEIALGLENKGTIHVSPRGQVVFKNILGQEVDKVYINLDQRKVLPRGIWQETLKIETNDPRAIGPIKAELTVVYGLTQNQISDITSFWYFPEWSLYIVGAFVILLIMIVIGIRVVRSRFRR
ncbi:MAG: hypothetical protein CO137_02815 [Candidatus Magasanikbacteria bacterium CG_4_9_14_3_um_filter_32_9]|uniref:DUF916 domain-containing protein n=1 Tax=Candidatus Magasanikbacteria bacterium CG_4_9_14_3_um_filter_32_9 TaxID=1974644 RepID=A0A2M7Z6H6_9BACT|nr:MAG: hypothetical protein CO137_02815 [Candidatus Magasanikbacteria bacterium CG_4_9_14_3_um_filter_32_9]